MPCQAGCTVGSGAESIEIKELGATVEDGKINRCRINAKISFTPEGP